DGHVGLRAGVGLHVGMFRAEEFLRALDRDGLDDVGRAAAAVVALAGIALGVLVREHRAHRREHGLRDVILGRDQLERVVLTLRLEADRISDFLVDAVDAPLEKIVSRGCALLFDDRHRLPSPEEAILLDNQGTDAACRYTYPPVRSLLSGVRIRLL